MVITEEYIFLHYFEIVRPWIFFRGFTMSSYDCKADCKASCNLGGQSRNMLPFTQKSENQILRIVISSILRIK